MEKLKTEETVTKATFHEIYCDNCGKLIATEREDYDGYYDTHTIEQRIYIFRNYLVYKKTLCTACREKDSENLLNKLCELGFEKDTK